jgi:starvation-inducible DNA-binding protein
MNRPLWNTQNALAEKVRTGAVELLNQQLADALDLALQAKQAHWNVKGPSFIEYPLEIHSGREHVTALSRAIATFGASARAGIDAATELGDADTADLFTEISRRVDKLLWKVEAHGQAKD